ncbi:MAG: gamma-glutamylcyclotransferase family protein [Cyanobacteria bacterium P01_F01_bin.53]
MNNTKSRLHNVFFYGLYMDPDILASKAVAPRAPRIGFAAGYRLRIGNMATLLRDETSQAHGIVYSLTHEEIDTLYAKAGLDMCVSESLLVTLDSGENIPTLCKNLRLPPEESESNADYEAKLVQCMVQLKVPTTHISNV